jgi:hypothetical protein
MVIRKRRIVLIVLGVLFAAAAAILAFHSVSLEVTPTDAEYIAKFTEGIEPVPAKGAFDKQIDFIKRVQDSVLTIAPINKELPFGSEREPRNLYEARHGLCFDRSRVIEKILRQHGYRTRHIFILSTKETNAPKAFATPGVASHAVSEVLTERGWLVIDSNDRWVSLDVNGQPVSMAGVSGQADTNPPVVWQEPPPVIYSDIAPFTYVYGLYSRHGEFYPPYNFIPDVNYTELIENIY